MLIFLPLTTLPLHYHTFNTQILTHGQIAVAQYLSENSIMLSCVCDSILLCSVFESSLFSLGCCKSVLLSATGAADVLWPKYLGTFEATGEEYEGKTVYKNNDGRYLYRHSDGTWRTGYGIGASGIIKSVVETAECPVSQSVAIFRCWLALLTSW